MPAPMPRFGYTLMTEQSGPRGLVGYAAAAERAGFDFLVSSDHYFPWLESMGHAPYAWTVLGAVAQATESIPFMTYVTCPTMRYHPAVIAQKAATLAVLSGERFTLGLGSGENLNEHVVGHGWPGVTDRQEMLAEAVEIIRTLFDGEQHTLGGDYFQIDQAKLWDLPDEPVQIGLAVSGPESIARFAPLGDHLIAVEPDAALVNGWNAARPEHATSRKIGQIPICWGPDKDAAITRAHRLFRWFGGGWSVNANLPTPASFAAGSQFVRPADVAGSIKCGPDLDELSDAVQPFLAAGFTDVALVQIGDENQTEFITDIAPKLLDKIRAYQPT